MILVDMNSLGFAASAGKPLHSGDLPTQGVFGVLNRLFEIRQQYRGKMVCLWDSRSWRYDIYPAYKANRKAAIVITTPGAAAPAVTPSPEPPSKSLQALLDLKTCWEIQKPYVVKLLRTMGVAQMMARNLEADDLAARLVKLKPNNDHLLITGDADWKQLVAPNVTWYCPIEYKIGPDSKPKPSIITPANFEAATGCRTPWDFVQTKALTGDMGDNIPGVGGIGPVNAKYILDTHGSVDALFNESMLGNSASWPKRVREFADDEDRRKYYEFNLLMVWLNHPHVPAAVGSKLVSGPQLPDTFIDICGELAFTSILAKHDRFLGAFNPDNKENQ